MALVHRQFTFLPGEVCITCGMEGNALQGEYPEWDVPGDQRPSAVGSCPLRVEETGSALASHAARGVATRCVMVQKSAEAIVGAQVKRAEGPNNERQGADPTISAAPMNPKRGRCAHGGGGEKRALRQDEVKQEGLLEKVLARDNLLKAWKRVRANKGAPGIDGVTVGAFVEQARQHWPRIKEQIERGRYEPQPVKRVEIPKAGGGKRALGIPTVMDRVIQQAIAQVLSPLYEVEFSPNSYGFRPGRNAHQAIGQVQQDVKQGYKFAVDMDLAKFFDTVNHDVLMGLLSRTIGDKKLLRLIGNYLRAGVLVGYRVEPSEVGTPQGGPLSPLLGNVMLHELDKQLHSRGHRFARYADDVVILVRSLRAGHRVMQSVKKFVEAKLRLRVNQAKSQVAPMGECKFLGFTIKAGKIRWHKKALEGFKNRVRRLTSKGWGVSMEYRLGKLREYVRGWMQYFGISQYWRSVPGLDEWIRRRMRSVYWKRWKRRRTKIRELLRLGVNRRMAFRHGLSGKGNWRMARSPGLRIALTNERLHETGLVSVVALWKKAQGYT